jgi:Arc/MetJ-type ribon-helix-helix transcriptional regulator
MAYEFPPDIQERIEAQLQTGRFQTEDDVIREAMDTLERRQRGLSELQNMVGEADTDIQAGRVGPFDAEGTKQAVRERLAKHGLLD